METKLFRVVLILIAIPFLGSGAVFAQEPEAVVPGMVEGTGTSFEITDSEYLNVTLQSSEPVKILLESVPSTVTAHIEAAEGATSAEIAFGGLAPSTIYYMYEDSYENGGEITTDATGGYAWTQDLSGPHLVWLQPNPSTKFIRDDATGGDCASIGSWNPSTKTCTLGMNVYETIEIMNDDLTLDGAGYSVQGLGSGYGIYLTLRTGVTIKNIDVTNFSYGIFLRDGNNITLTGNTISIVQQGLMVFYGSDSTLADNTVSALGNGIWLNDHSGSTLTGNSVMNCGVGIYVSRDSDNTLLASNVVSNNTAGFSIRQSDNNLLTNNMILNNRDGANFNGSNGNTLTGNNFSHHRGGVYFFRGSNDNQIYRNSFFDSENRHARVDSDCTGNLFDSGAPTGGNFWDDWTSPDSNGDGFVDVPYTFIGGVDNLPWASSGGWDGPPDADNDGVADTEDNCPDDPNSDQLDTDADGIGDVCDPNPLGLCYPLPDGLIAWWSGNGSAADLAYLFPGEPVGVIGYAAGMVDDALTLDGAGGHVAIEGVPVPPTAISIEAWVRRDGAASSVVASQYDSSTGGNSWYLYVASDGSVQWAVVGVGGGTSRVVKTEPGLMPQGATAHLAATLEIVDETTADLRIYVDGQSQPLTWVNDVAFSQIRPVSTPVRLGAVVWSGGVPASFWNGWLDEVTLYDRALTPEDVFLIHEAGPTGKCSAGLDTDGDGAPNAGDNCPGEPNPEQTDTDLDGDGDACDADDDDDGILDGEDNCQFRANPDQFDLDIDGLGDACDADLDGDDVLNESDNCPAEPNPYQDDTDLDGAGDACDEDDDNDGVCDTGEAGVACTAGPDNCSTVANPDQADLDGDAIGDACDSDVDGDGTDNDADNCMWAPNPSQDDTDVDGDGDACDTDDDNDSWPDGEDNCPLVSNVLQGDVDGDGLGDACDADLDGDGVANEIDNCPTTPNSGQTDLDGDGLGDACDPDIDGDAVTNGSDLCAATPLGELVDPGNGCSIAQLCPCDGPRGTNQPWKNHGKYVSCNAHATGNFVDLGLITEEEKDALVSAAAQSDCGRKD